MNSWDRLRCSMEGCGGVWEDWFGVRGGWVSFGRAHGRGCRCGRGRRTIRGRRGLNMADQTFLDASRTRTSPPWSLQEARLLHLPVCSPACPRRSPPRPVARHAHTPASIHAAWSAPRRAPRTLDSQLDSATQPASVR